MPTSPPVQQEVPASVALAGRVLGLVVLVVVLALVVSLLSRRIGWRASWNLGMAEQGSNVLLPTGGVGGTEGGLIGMFVVYGAFSRRPGSGSRRASRRCPPGMPERPTATTCVASWRAIRVAACSSVASSE